MLALRHVLAIAAVAVALGDLRPARAQTTPTPTPQPTTPQFAKSDFLIRLMKNDKKDGKDNWIFMSAQDLKYFFNRARCECKTPVRIAVDLSQTGNQKKNFVQVMQGTAQVLVGPSNCLDAAPQTRDAAHCRNPRGAMQGDLVANVANFGMRVDTTVQELFAVNGQRDQPGACTGRFTQKVWFWLPASNLTTPALTADNAPQFDLEVDGEAPPAPTNVTVTPGNEALKLNWPRLTGVSDLNGYVVFCSRAGASVFDGAFFDGRAFQTPKSVCQSNDVAPPNPPANFPTNVAANGLPILAPDELRRLDPKFTCSGLLTSATSPRISGLQNGIPYVMGVASVDRMGNASPIEVGFVQSPILTKDFFTAYREAGGQAEGGFCAVGNGAGPGRAGWAVGLLALALALALRARRSRR